MIKITINNLSSKSIHCNSKTKSLLKILQENYIDWMHACGGKGRCTTCKAIIVDGMNNMTPKTVFEENYQRVGRLDNNERLSCQAIVEGNLVIEVPELYKLPHIDYSK